jgi:hypothetical protein
MKVAFHKFLWLLFGKETGESKNDSQTQGGYWGKDPGERG